MAKQASVFYKLPIEEMRGKLATKQDGIMYAGQEQGENTLSIGDGSHAATNFEKYIVVTKSRGKNRFYVKSRTTVANTTGTVNTRAILALAMPLVDAIYARRDDEVVMVAFKEAYEYYKKNETLREYITKIVVESIRRGKANIEYQSVPTSTGITEKVALMDNPLNVYNRQAVTVMGSLAYGANPKEARSIQEYVKYRAVQMGGLIKKINVHDTVSGSTYQMVWVVQRETFGDMSGTTQGVAFGIEVSESAVTIMTLRPFKLDYAVTGVPYLDAAKTQVLAPSTVIANITDLYI